MRRRVGVTLTNREEDATAPTAHELRTHEALSDVDAALLEALVEHGRAASFAAGDVISAEGQPADAVHFVLDGDVDFARADGDGQLELGSIGAGGSFGELEVLGSLPFPVTATAATATHTFSLSSDVVRSLSPDHPDLVRLLTSSASRQLHSLQREVVQHTERLRETQFEIIFRLGRAAEFRDDDTGIHITRMSRFAARVALEMGLDDRTIELLLHSAPMHDIGKIGIPDEILLKPGKLTDEEFDTMKTHTEIGAELLSGSQSPVVQMAQQVALSHHEKWNGSGYPEGLEGENIPLEARICCVVDVFDALISERPYKQAWTVDDALAEIERCSDAMFDPQIATVFIGLKDDVREILERTASTAAMPAVSRSATLYFLTQQASGTT